jgi:hypothetical protein
MRRRPVQALALVLVTALVAASSGCGGNSNSAATTAATTTATTTGTTTATTTASAATTSTATTATTATTGSTASPRITSVTFTGGPTDPTVTIVGTGFGSRPQPSPSYQPAPPEGTIPPYGCTTGGNVGYDYAVNLWLVDSAEGRGWAAGRYRPGVKELDCVGLLLSSYTPTKIVYRLGADYKAHAYQLATGDPYQVAVKDALKQGIVRYTIS